MRIEVLLSSGENDTWHNVSDATVEHGALHILEEIVPSPTSPTDEELEKMKVVWVESEIDNGPDLPPGKKRMPYLHKATYAPGMWMKVVFDS